MKYSTTNHCKHLIKYHIILVTKYRRDIFVNQSLRDFTKQVMSDIADKSDFKIHTQEIDTSKPNHWHGLIESVPRLSPSQIVRRLKQQSHYILWQNFRPYLSRFYWNENVLWTDGYFCSSIGDVSSKTLQEYIDSQG